MSHLIPPLSGRQWFTVAEVAAMLRVSKMSIYRRVESCEITPAVRIGHQYRIHHTALTDYLNRAEVGGGDA